MNTKTVYTKITPDHLRRQALVYIRQSTTQQVRSNHESVERQYALVERAVALGWAPEATHTIDEDQGRSGTSESSMTKVAVSEALFRVADRCVQVLGGTGVTRDTVVQQVFREIRAFRIYDGPSEVHRWSLAKKIQRNSQR